MMLLTNRDKEDTSYDKEFRKLVMENIQMIGKYYSLSKRKVNKITIK